MKIKIEYSGILKLYLTTEWQKDEKTGKKQISIPFFLKACFDNTLCLKQDFLDTAYLACTLNKVT